MGQSVDYPNPKVKFIGELFGPVIDWFERSHFGGGTPGLIILGAFVYIFVIRKKIGKKFNWHDKIAIGVWFFFLALTIFIHISQIMGRRKAYPFLPERVQHRLEKFPEGQGPVKNNDGKP
jgi:energy-coupling factor transporter transmembrane protein EcfT